MIKALLLIFDPSHTWDKIEKDQDSLARVVLLFLLPLLLVTAAVETYGLVRFGREQGFSNQVRPVPQELALRYETVQLGLTALLLIGGSWLIQKIAEGFHRRHTFGESFRTVAFSLSPLLLFRMLNAWPLIDTWISWAIGIFLSVAALYRGIPRIMKPDPSNALGLYLLASLLLILMTGLAHFVGGLVLEEKILTGGWGL